jgi:DNA invertase Pin-like site-specific DNA recombinase
MGILYLQHKEISITTAVYIRVSTVGQNEAGQRRELERWLAVHGISDAAWFVDKKSGTNLDRPAFKRMEKAIFDGEVKTIVVWKLDRLARSLRDGINTLADWCDRGLRVVSITQQLDFNGAMGKMLAAVLFGLAEMEQETRKERQAVGIAAARERGVYKGRKPGSTKVDPARVAELREKGLSAAEIATSLGISRASVYRLAGTA